MGGITDFDNERGKIEKVTLPAFFKPLEILQNNSGQHGYNCIMFAELVINIEMGLENNFHYHVPADLQDSLQIGQLVEVEFGPRLAQGIIVAFLSTAEVADTKPVIAPILESPVVQPWQIELAKWLSREYLAPLNGCLRLMLPPGLTRWADITVAINPYWDGSGRITDTQQQILDLLREKGDLRGQQLGRALPKVAWKEAVNQLVRRKILLRGSVLEPPRAKPKEIKTAELSASPKRIALQANQLGRPNKQADILHFLSQSPDPLPTEADVLAETGATLKHLEALAQAGYIQRTPATTIVVPAGKPTKAIAPHLPAAAETLDPALLQSWIAAGFVHQIEQPASVGLIAPPPKLLVHIFELRKATIYQDILHYLTREARPVALTQLYAATKANSNHLKKLEKLDLVRLGAEEVWRDPLADRDFAPAEAPLLTHDQARAWGRIKVAMLSNEPADEETTDEEEPTEATPRPEQPFLLHGVTGSGKTEIYMRAIEFALQRGQQAIVLVPEIALTPQTVRRFAARFPGRVAVLHSGLSEGERFDTWRRAKQGLFDIIVGPRSALFSPLPNIGVIVIDEEHDHSYKQTPPVPPPYYHARETAVELGRILGATVILGSATPDLVTYHQARSGRYQLIELPRRVMGHRQRIESQAQRLQLASQYLHNLGDPDDALTIPLPPVQLVDMRQELRAGNRSVFSRPLQQAITDTLSRHEQAILFLNRRGTATFIMCRDCGHVLKCPRCDMPLTYHRPGLLLSCHHCGRKEQPRPECPKCASHRIKFFGLGTEELESLVQQQWPAARIVRWDRDTTAGRDTHEQLLASFINHEADILVGTQMIAKGLDLPLVTLVGVISADVSLGLPDYQTGERAFQLLTQVSGRAGRGLLGGRVLIQTYNPDHYAIQAAAEHDYPSFYLEEIRFRTQHALPPFRRLARLLIADPVSDRAQNKAEEVAKALRLHIREKELGATEILGPMPPFFSRIDGRYRWQLIVRSPNPIRLLEDFPITKDWVVDIDPVSTL